ncbi:uncharacterized protein LOC141714879 [Apium graveolens]|uniref:uncharacterized protein LOC141714879 n=1 Tax=Apium graveolens TaxID=4045 RepID=UPI003D7A0BCE
MESIVFRFGVPRIVVTDNGAQFVGSEIEKTFEQLQIQHSKASVAYPQCNGQVGITNKTILQCIKKRLAEADKLWVDKLPNVLSSYRATPRTFTGKTPFKMAYGTEAVLPIKVSLGSARLQNFNAEESSEGLRLNCDLVEELRDSTHLKIVKFQEKTSKYFNAKVKPSFKVDDLVLREEAVSQPGKVNKLSSPWEGPYRVAKVVRRGTFLLTHLDGSPIPNTWNAIHLRNFYS